MSRKRACEQLSYDLLQMSVGEWDETEDEDDGRERQRRLKETLQHFCEAKLTPKQRFCVEEYYFRGRTIYEIAGKMEVCPSTVSRHLKCAVEKLRSMLLCVTL